MPSAAFDHATTHSSPSGAVDGSAFVPEEDAQLGPSALPKVAPRPAFYYFVHPHRWQVIGGKVLPLPGKLKLRAGLMNVSASRQKKGGVNLRLAHAGLAEKMRKVIPIDSLPKHHTAPGAPRSYLKAIEAERGRVVMPIYEQAFNGTAQTRADKDRWVEFLEYQLTSGLVAPPETWVLENMREERIKALERMDKSKSTNHAKRGRLRSEIEVIAGELEKRVDKLEPATSQAVTDLGVDPEG